MIRAIRHTGLVVADLDRALHFWCDVLGFKVTKQMEETGSHLDAMMGLTGVRVTTVKMAAPDGHLLELLRFHSHPDKPGWEGTPYSTGFTHIALTVDNLDQLVSQLMQEGVSFPASPQCSPNGYARVIYAKGPEGILLELVEVLKT
ncbi:VOC family protein [Laribacter hongkongensis]|uniref:VOC family protein n=1 Tax=Laribacter hongkongensis TaxID=168471 RepID=UPI000489D0B1|nr:VOC family protein [Laribacter hongkongensis]